MKKKLFLCACLMVNLLVGEQPLFKEGKDCQINNTPDEKPLNLEKKIFPAIVFVATETNPFTLAYGDNPPSYYTYIRPWYEKWWPSEFYHGSGFLVSEDGYIITNEHVVEDATSILVMRYEDELKVYKANVIGKDRRTDIAVLKIQNESNSPFPYLKLADSDKVEVGDTVYTVGSPMSEALYCTVSKGIISGKHRDDINDLPIQGYLQTDAVIYGGSSGCPVINTQGEVIGVMRSGIRNTALSFLVPVNTAKVVSEQLIKKGEVAQGFLGVVVHNEVETAFNAYYFYNNVGATVVDVIKGSPADSAGIQAGDIVLEVDGIKILSPQFLKNRVCVLPPDSFINLIIKRDNKILTKKIKLGPDELSKRYTSVIYYDNGPLFCF